MTKGIKSGVANVWMFGYPLGPQGLKARGIEELVDMAIKYNLAGGRDRQEVYRQLPQKFGILIARRGDTPEFIGLKSIKVPKEIKDEIVGWLNVPADGVVALRRTWTSAPTSQPLEQLLLGQSEKQYQSTYQQRIRAGGTGNLPAYWGLAYVPRGNGGVIISHVHPNGPAAFAGLHVGDLINSVWDHFGNHFPINKRPAFTTLGQALSNVPPLGTVRFSITPEKGKGPKGPQPRVVQIQGADWPQRRP